MTTDDVAGDTCEGVTPGPWTYERLEAAARTHLAALQRMANLEEAAARLSNEPFRTQALERVAAINAALRAIRALTGKGGE